MSTIQIIAIAVAAVIVLLLIAALLVTRRRAADVQPPTEVAESEATSFLDEEPQDTLSGLGEANRMVEGPAVGSESDFEARSPESAAAEAPAGSAASAAAAAAPGPVKDDVETTGELPVVETPIAPPGDSVAAVDGLAGDGGEAAAYPVSERAAAPDGTASGQGNAAARRAAGVTSGAAMVPLSEIIVTTSSKLVDLNDPDVRRMLTDLVKLEVDQAIESRRQGQTVDAVMQLTEAEKISRALGLKESCERIRAMIDELNRTL